MKRLLLALLISLFACFSYAGQKFGIAYSDYSLFGQEKSLYTMLGYDLNISDNIRSENELWTSLRTEGANITKNSISYLIKDNLKAGISNIYFYSNLQKKNINTIDFAYGFTQWNLAIGYSFLYQNRAHELNIFWKYDDIKVSLELIYQNKLNYSVSIIIN